MKGIWKAGLVLCIGVMALAPGAAFAGGVNQSCGADNGGNLNQPGNGNNVSGSHQPDGCTVVDGVPYNC
jgi:hypothetical protein